MDKLKFRVMCEKHFPTKTTEFNERFDVGPAYANPWINTICCVMVNF